MYYLILSHRADAMSAPVPTLVGTFASQEEALDFVYSSGQFDDSVEFHMVSGSPDAYAELAANLTLSIVFAG
jgi:hypothetical protein